MAGDTSNPMWPYEIPDPPRRADESPFDSVLNIDTDNYEDDEPTICGACGQPRVEEPHDHTEETCIRAALSLALAMLHTHSIHLTHGELIHGAFAPLAVERLPDGGVAVRRES